MRRQVEIVSVFDNSRHSGHKRYYIRERIVKSHIYMHRTFSSGKSEIAGFIDNAVHIPRLVR